MSVVVVSDSAFEAAYTGGRVGRITFLRKGLVSFLLFIIGFSSSFYFGSSFTLNSSSRSRRCPDSLFK